MLGPRNRAKFWEEHVTQTHVTQTATWNLPHTGTNTHRPGSLSLLGPGLHASGVCSLRGTADCFCMLVGKGKQLILFGGILC